MPINATQRFADFAAGLNYAALPETVKEHLTIFMLDYLRVASLGQRMPWSAWATNLARELGGQAHATVLFSSDRTDPERATFVNTTYSGSIDADDVHVGSMLHPGCIVISAALAIGEARHLRGDRILAAIAAGYENMIRIGLAIQPSHFRRGFQSTATCGGFGAGTAAASLLFTGSDRSTRIAETIGLVASFSGGLTQFYHSGSTVKRIHAAHAAGEGVHAALLAEAGFSGPVDILEGKDGFARAYADGHDFDKGLAQLGTTWRLLETAIKPHACSARVLSAVEATAALCSEHQLTIADIKAIRVGIPKIIQGRLTVNQPKDIQAAQMSLPFCMAMVLHQGTALAPGFTLNVDDFESALADPRVMAISQRVECMLDPDAERVSTEQSVGAKVTLTLQSGKIVERFVEAPQGSAARPFTMADHVARFQQEMAKRFTAAQVDVLLAEVRGFAQSANPDRLMHLLAART
ncbi:MAG: MmgE/PrpD family protein [Betaproteobacteria bacterium]|nr:MAG: MmgE/PrpD family protein [Betaproteobacteria bacterium]